MQNLLLKTSALLFTIAILSGCQNKTQNEVQDSEVEKYSYSKGDVMGTWRNLSMRVTYMETDSVFDVPEGEWENVLKIKPIVTTYKEDMTFSSSYYGLNDSLLFNRDGTWSFSQDSIYLTTDGETSAYKFDMENNVGEFTGMIDWDADGNAKELYTGKQIRNR